MNSQVIDVARPVSRKSTPNANSDAQQQRPAAEAVAEIAEDRRHEELQQRVHRHQIAAPVTAIGSGFAGELHDHRRHRRNDDSEPEAVDEHRQQDEGEGGARCSQSGPVIRGPRIVRHMSYPVLVSPLHPDWPRTRRIQHGPDRSVTAGDRARAAAAALCRAGFRRLPHAVRQDLADPVRAPAAHAAPSHRWPKKRCRTCTCASGSAPRNTKRIADGRWPGW